MTKITVLLGPGIKEQRSIDYWLKLNKKIGIEVEFRALCKDAHGQFYYPIYDPNHAQGAEAFNRNDLTPLDENSHIVIETHGEPRDKQDLSRGLLTKTYTNTPDDPLEYMRDIITDVAAKVPGKRILLNSCYSGIAIRSAIINNTELHNCSLLSSTGENTRIQACYEPLLDVAVRYFCPETIDSEHDFFTDDRIKYYPADLTLMLQNGRFSAVNKKSILPDNATDNEIAPKFKHWSNGNFVISADNFSGTGPIYFSGVKRSTQFNLHPLHNWLTQLIDEFKAGNAVQQNSILAIITHHIHAMSNEDLFTDINDSHAPSLAEELFHNLASFDIADDLLISITDRLGQYTAQPLQEGQEHAKRSKYKHFLISACARANHNLINHITNVFTNEFARDLETINNEYNLNLLMLVLSGNNNSHETAQERDHRISTAYDTLCQKIQNARPSFNLCMSQSTRAFKETMRRLIQQRSITGKNAFHLAAITGNLHAFENMYRIHPEPSKIELRPGDTSFMLAVKNKSHAILDFLLEKLSKTEINTVHPDGYTALVHAIRNNNITTVEALARCKKVNLTQKDAQNTLPIHEITQTGNHELLQQFLTAAGTRNTGWKEKGAGGCNILFYAIRATAIKQNSTILTTILGHNEQFVPFNQSSVDKLISTPNDRGILPIHYAAKLGSVSALQALVDSGANLNAKATSRNDSLHLQTPLNCAISHLNFDAINFLLEQDTINKNGVKNTETPLAVALHTLAYGPNNGLIDPPPLTEEQVTHLLNLIQDLVDAPTVDVHKKSELLNGLNMHEFMHHIIEGDINTQSELSERQQDILSNIFGRVIPTAAGACCWGPRCMACVQHNATEEMAVIT